MDDYNTGEIGLNPDYKFESLNMQEISNEFDGGYSNIFKDKTNKPLSSFEDLFNSKAYQKLDFTDRKGLQYN